MSRHHCDQLIAGDQPAVEGEFVIVPDWTTRRRKVQSQFAVSLSDGMKRWSLSGSIV